MRLLVLGCAALTFVAALLAVFFLDVPVALVATVGMGVLLLGWLVVVVTLPWNLHFQARHVLAEMKRSRERGIVVPDDRAAEAERVRRRTLVMSLGLHGLSAGGMALVAWLTGETLAWWFCGFYLLSTAVRPALEYHRHVRERLATLLSEVRYPRDDILSLVSQVNTLQHSVETHAREYRELFTSLRALEQTTTARDTQMEQRMAALVRKFEESVARLTDNQEVITGIRAFLRIIQEPPAH
ncbi:MAG: hypothetical protein HY904_00340 [Deltaproteobacteria bacterium]|nr:hypothetical protein [Deltaproteobacteria bacterium]